MPKIITIFWRDIPAQVNAKEGRKRAKKLLPARFQEAIDRAAMRAKKSDADAYLDDWRRETQSKSGDMNEIVAEIAASIESEYSDEKLDAIVRNKGLNPNTETGSDSSHDKEPNA
ncbi:MAG: virulence factor [Cocleimonas sp.]